MRTQETTLYTPSIIGISTATYLTRRYMVEKVARASHGCRFPRNCSTPSRKRTYPANNWTGSQGDCCNSWHGFQQSTLEHVLGMNLRRQICNALETHCLVAHISKLKALTPRMRMWRRHSDGESAALDYIYNLSGVDSTQLYSSFFSFLLTL